MARVATTFRIDPVVKAGLLKLSQFHKKPLNQLANEALRDFVARRILEIEDELESTLADLRAYRKSDPDFARAIDAFVDAEATSNSDPAEGRVMDQTGPTESRVLKLLND